jgi:polyisoprenoid-binding protein YceI
MRFRAVYVLAVVLAQAALAQHKTFTVNPDASEVKMTLKTTHELVNGSFHVQSGTVEFDHGAARMSGSVVVQAGSGKTGNGSRDKKMNKDILEVERYATISFEPKSYSGTIAWWCILTARARRPRRTLWRRMFNGG